MTTTSIVGYPFNSSSSTLDPISTNTTPIITTPIITNPTPIIKKPIIKKHIITTPISTITNVEKVKTEFD